jgi:hypothetical protein
MTVKQVWKASDGRVYDTEEEAIKADSEGAKLIEIERLFQNSPHSVADFIIIEWQTLKRIVEGTE